MIWHDKREYESPHVSFRTDMKRSLPIWRKKKGKIANDRRSMLSSVYTRAQHFRDSRNFKCNEVKQLTSIQLKGIYMLEWKHIEALKSVLLHSCSRWRSINSRLNRRMYGSMATWSHQRSSKERWSLHYSWEQMTLCDKSLQVKNIESTSRSLMLKKH